MTAIDWIPLRSALACCRDAGVAVPMWWRDDDAVAMTPALTQLTALARQTGVPVHLAIIPAKVSPDLADAIDPGVIRPVVHGWAHRDHSGRGEKKNEFQTARPGARDETHVALARMRDCFGPAVRPMFVPPWNRINDEVIAALAPHGYRALSTFGVRGQARVAGLDVINTHLDPIWWKGSRDLLDPDLLIAGAAADLTARATGAQDAAEPFGLLTHHLVHSPAIWSFAMGFLTEMQNGGATIWNMENDE
jgi:hypothetical protein